MKSYFDDSGHSSVSRGIIPYEKGGSPGGRAPINQPNWGYHDGKGETINLGPFNLGIEGTYLEKDPYDKSRDSNLNRFMMHGFIGFRF
jgi:hypothetical protein